MESTLLELAEAIEQRALETGISTKEVTKEALSSFYKTAEQKNIEKRLKMISDMTADIQELLTEEPKEWDILDPLEKDLYAVERWYKRHLKGDKDYESMFREV